MQKESRSFSGLEITIYALLAAVLVIAWPSAKGFVPSILAGMSTLFILATIRIQIRRYRSQRDNPASKRQNLWPMLGYLSLLGYSISLIVSRLPALSLVPLREQSLGFSPAWQWGVLFSFIGFLFLAIWAWNFIKLRPFLRTYVVFLTIAIVVSTLGSFIFSMLVFRIVESNNLRLMEQGSETQQVVMLDRENTSLILARTIANDSRFLEAFKGGQVKVLDQLMSDFFLSSGVDILKIYNSYGEIIVSPSDIRDRGRVANVDPLVTYVLKEKKHIKSFDKEAGVLSPLVVTHAFAPILSGTNAVGAVEVGYKFDTAFVDFSKKATGLETTIYTDDRRSATTITTTDGVSRWVGSQETDLRVLETTLAKGEVLSTSLDRLGTLYYSAFVPLRDINGKIIGMVSVGSPTTVLFEQTRQQLLSTFIILTLISLLVSFVGYSAIRNFRKMPS
ncbi:cache domain-containing protein [Candidatus Uhrbacteria bacterium]|nr:cache domain-containing protein [Candidatus Uhrbacteria bacterium]